MFMNGLYAGNMVGNHIATCPHGNYAPCEKCREVECVDVEDEEEDNDDDAHVFSRTEEGEG